MNNACTDEIFKEKRWVLAFMGLFWLLSACSEKQGVYAEHLEYRYLDEGQFIIEAAGRWLSSSRWCADKSAHVDLYDINLNRDFVVMNGGKVRASWHQIDDIKSYLAAIQKFASACPEIKENSISAAFLSLSTGPIEQVVAVSHNHLFTIESAGGVRYWKPYNESLLDGFRFVDIYNLNDSITIEVNVDYKVGDESTERFNIVE